MQQIQDLQKKWNDGALALDGEDAKVLTLLSVAYGRTVNSSVLVKLRRASQHLRRGDECHAAMEVALVLPVLAEPSDGARRLFIADGLIADGVAPRDIWTALEFDTAPLDALEKYNRDEPRNPKGDGRASGEWINWDDASVIPPGALDDLSTNVRGKYGRHVLAMYRETKFLPGQEHLAAAHVSSGKGDHGGVSYGAFQLALRERSPRAFLKGEGAPWAPQFAQYDDTKPNGDFANAWKAVAAAEPEAFFQAQMAFVERTYYDPLVARVLSTTGVDIDRMSDAVQNAVLSIGVNNTGGAKGIVTRAINDVSLQGLTPTSDGYDAALIDQLYAERQAYIGLLPRTKRNKQHLTDDYDVEHLQAQMMRLGLL